MKLHAREAALPHAHLESLLSGGTQAELVKKRYERMIARCFLSSAKEDRQDDEHMYIARPRDMCYRRRVAAGGSARVQQAGRVTSEMVIIDAEFLVDD